MPADGAETDVTQYSTDDAAATPADSRQHTDDEHSPDSNHREEDGRHEQARSCMILWRAMIRSLVCRLHQTVKRSGES